MEENGGGSRRREPLLVAAEEEVAKGSWKLNLKEFRLPSQTDDHQPKQSFTLQSLLCKPSEAILSFFRFCCLLC